jgi:hypothetical protein
VALVWLALLVALGLLAASILRRMSVLAGRTRELERYQAAVASIDLRLGAVVDPLVRGLDETRRRSGDPASLAVAATEAQVVIDGLAAETRALSAPAGLVAPAAEMCAELERAARAASLVEHGLGALANAGIARDLEGQTSVKRGALNLRNARDAFGLLARRIAEIRPADLATGPAGKGARGGAPPVTLPGDASDGSDI